MKLTCIFLIVLSCILCNSQLSFYYAAQGLNLWFERMIPVLFPFMILSGIMVRLKLTEKIAIVLKPVLGTLFRVNGNVCYAIFMGFLCGFPMGAKVVSELYSNNMITKREGEFLMAFCNNIGPVYFVGFVLPLLGLDGVLPYVFGMYGIPFVYGLILRYTYYKDLNVPVTQKSRITPRDSVNLTQSLFNAVDDSIHASIQSILALGGYMILFNMLNLLPHLCLGEKHQLFAPLLEITGGLSILGDKTPIYSLLVLSFGGLSCLAQTYHCIRETDLSISQYTLHKIMLTILHGLFYLGWFLLNILTLR